jgi:hypothetical protein
MSHPEREKVKTVPGPVRLERSESDEKVAVVVTIDAIDPRTLQKVLERYLGKGSFTVKVVGEAEEPEVDPITGLDRSYNVTLDLPPSSVTLAANSWYSNAIGIGGLTTEAHAPRSFFPWTSVRDVQQ